MNPFISIRWFMVFGCLAAHVFVNAQCTTYVISVTTGSWPSEVSWSVTQGSTTYASGGAPASITVCLNNGTYQFNMFDAFGDGWNGSNWAISCTSGTVIASGTLAGGSFASQSVTLSGSLCVPPPPPTCSPGFVLYDFAVTTGSWPSEVSWSITLNGSPVLSGGAPFTGTVCLTMGCYVLNLNDAFGDGWNGSVYTLSLNGSVVYTGTLTTGSSGMATFSIAGGDCTGIGPVTASECIDAVNVCDNLSFAVDPNGYGAVWEIPMLGTLANPDLIAGDGILSSWGTDNWGCLRNEELNSTWMIINIWGGGTLEFSFGGFGTQVGYYDWIMYDYASLSSCQDIYYNVVAPVRCNWNGVPWGGTGLASVLPPGGNWSNYETPIPVLAGDQFVVCFSNWSSVSTTVPLDFGGTAIVSCQSILLPVDLLSFDARNMESGVQLDWSTGSEQNNQYFDIERSADVGKWNPIGRVGGVGNSMTVSHYSFTDSEPAVGSNYYRLRQVDVNGQFWLSGIQEVDVEGRIDPIFPNPSNGLFYLRGQLPGSTIHVTDAVGRNMAFTFKIFDESNGLAVFELDNPRPGYYFVVLEDKTSWPLIICGE